MYQSDPNVAVAPSCQKMLGIRRIGFDFFSNSSDVYVNNFFFAEIFRSPDMVKNIGTAEICALIAEKVFKNLEFNLRNVDFSSVAGKNSAFAIKSEIARGDNIFVIFILSVFS